MASFCLFPSLVACLRPDVGIEVALLGEDTDTGASDIERPVSRSQFSHHFEDDRKR
jgi:hypothetical protein